MRSLLSVVDRRLICVDGSDASVASLTILGRRLIGENGTCNYQEEEDLVRLKRWFVIACLETLGDLASAVPRVLPPDGIPTFGSKDLQAMALLVALIALWGLGPSLAGKGLASLGLGALAQKLSFPNPDASVSVQMPQDWLLLAQVCTTLHGVITAISPLETSPGHLVLHHHLIPTLAGFLTLGYGTCDDVDVAVWTKARNQLESILAEEKT